MAKLPNFQKLWDNYPGKQSADEVKQLIGGAVNADWITNTCTIRMSRAFNLAGFKVPFGHKFAAGGQPAMLNTVKGGDGLRYAFRVAEFLKYMKEQFGKPQIRILQERGSAMPDAFKGRQGIVVFNDCGWSDATGHFDLWNRDQIGHEGYWDKAKEVYLWAADGKYTVTSSSTLNQNGTPVVTLGR